MVSDNTPGRQTIAFAIPRADWWLPNIYPDVWNGLAAEHGVGRAEQDALRPALLDRLGRLGDRAAGRDHVVDDDHVAAVHLADQVLDGGVVRRMPALVQPVLALNVCGQLSKLVHAAKSKDVHEHLIRLSVFRDDLLEVQRIYSIGSVWRMAAG